MLGLDPLRLAEAVLAPDHFMPPVVPAGPHLAVSAQARVDDDAFDRPAAFGEGLVDRSLQVECMAAAPAAVGCDDHLRTGILDAVLHRIRRETAEDDGVDRTDPRAGLHRDDGLGYERHVDHDAVALADTLRLQAIREPADLGVQLGISEPAHVAGLSLEDDRSLAGVFAEMDIEAIVADVQLAVGEPAVVRRVAIVQGDRKRLLPGDLGDRQVRPEADIIRGGLCMQRVQLGPIDAGTCGERR